MPLNHYFTADLELGKIALVEDGRLILADFTPREQYALLGALVKKADAGGFEHLPPTSGALPKLP